MYLGLIKADLRVCPTGVLANAIARRIPGEGLSIGQPAMDLQARTDWIAWADLERHANIQPDTRAIPAPKPERPDPVSICKRKLGGVWSEDVRVGDATVASPTRTSSDHR